MVDNDSNWYFFYSFLYKPKKKSLPKKKDPHASYDINDNDPDPTPADNGDNK